MTEDNRECPDCHNAHPGFERVPCARCGGSGKLAATETTPPARTWSSQPPAVYLVRGECADYYCGCGLGHLLAVTGTKEHGEELIATATGKGTFYNVGAEGPFTLGELVPEDLR